MTDSYATILVERHDLVGLITLNRPEALNALTIDLMREVTSAVTDFDADSDIGCIVITGTTKAFAAGADITEMQSRTYIEMFNDDWFAGWEAITAARTPVIAAVAGYALGGGCELAMMCDTIIAADNARFGQPELSLGIPPGMGGSQRLTRLVGKAKAMDMCLTGRTMDASEAERAGLVSRVVPADELIDESLKIAAGIAAMSGPITKMVKESVNRAFETTLAEGIRFERRLFQAAFATTDQKEGMRAFTEKRPPAFKNQ